MKSKYYITASVAAYFLTFEAISTSSLKFPFFIYSINS